MSSITQKVHRPAPKQAMPAGAKKAFQGQIFSIFQWQQELFDGSTAIFEKLARADSVGVLAITPEKKIIVCEQEQPSLRPFVGLLGGIVDAGEQVLDAAKRELKEESGLVSDDWQLWFATQPLEKIDWAVYLYIARDCTFVQDQRLESGEKITLLTLSFEDFLEYAMTPNFRDKEVTLKIAQMLYRGQKDYLKKLLLG